MSFLPIRKSSIAALTASLILFTPLCALAGGKAQVIAERISALFSVFQSHVAKEKNGAVYLTLPRLTPLREGSLVEIVDQNGKKAAIAMLDRVGEKFARAKIIKKTAPIIPGQAKARGTRLPVRLLFISGRAHGKNEGRLISRIEETLRESGSLDLAPADVAYFLLKRNGDLAPESLPLSELQSAAVATRSDFIIMLSIYNKKKPAVIKLTVLDKSGYRLLTESFTWDGGAV
ncbi:hypothetical protein MNBD_NITROSPINAE04-1998 [hydrothermal vent metagenome]|uniref:Uncharacterized protein n=1 Tax=hydrothermal vent metagenome TaxID=652676 RepID=A0A3B1BWC2_9ZZZZ